MIGITAFLATLAMPLVPEFFQGPAALFAALFGVQLVLGVSQGAIFPISAGVFEAWFPAKRWAFVQGLQTAGLGLGAALTPPLIVYLMTRLGWQRALVWASLPAVALIAFWAWYGRKTPREHPSVSAHELAQIGSQPPAHSSVSVKQLLALMGNRNVILLFVSYMSMNYTFYLLSNWVFLYLIQERHFLPSLESVSCPRRRRWPRRWAPGRRRRTSLLAQARQPPGLSYTCRSGDDLRCAAVAGRRQRLQSLSCVAALA